MLVVHGLWLLGDGLAIWAEDAELPVKSRSQALRSTRDHPFAAAVDTLSQLFVGNAAQTTLLLPSLRSAPLDSPQLVRSIPRPVHRTDPILLPWIVPILLVEPATALSPFGEGPGWIHPPSDHRLADDTAARPGDSVQYWHEIASLAQDLVERGRVLPTLTYGIDDAAARWRPVVQGGDVAVVQSLVSAMPPSCRATIDRPDPHDIVITALGVMVDATVRATLPANLLLTPQRRGRRPRRLPTVEVWLAALTGPDGRLRADTDTDTDTEDDELNALAAALAPFDDIGAGRVGPARGTFRLTEVSNGQGLDDGGEFGPDDAQVREDQSAGATTEPATTTADSSWRLEFLLQSTADPSLLVPAQQVWTNDGALDRWLPRPQELLLTELGRASRVYPELATGLRQAQPCGLDLDASGAYGFLVTAAPALDEAGFGVLLPNWWDRRKKLGLAASASTPTDGVVAKKGKFGKESLLNFRWQLAIDDNTLTEKELAALAATKAPLVRLRGQWVAVDPEQLRRGLEFVQRQPAGTKTVAELLRLAASFPDDIDAPLPLAAVRADGWLGDLLAGSSDASFTPVPLPRRFAATLRPYQERGLAWLAFLGSLGLGACLADDMGLGKTVQLLALESAIRAADPDTGPTLLVCPMSLVGNWQREADRFDPELRVYAHHGRDRLRGNDLRVRLGKTDLMLSTYATATRDIDELAEYQWERVVLDEAQAIKNALSQSAKAVKRLTASGKVALTGTPVENRLAELWSIMDFLNPGMLGTPEKFRTRYAIPVERHGQTEPARLLRRITRPYILRRLKTDPTVISDLPEKIEIKQYCQLTTEQASLYRSVVDDMMEKIEASDGILRRGLVLAAMTKLKQVCNHPALLLHDRSPIGARSGKVIRLEELLEEILAEDDRVLCFTQYTEFAEMLLPHLATKFATDVAYLHGGTTKQRRDQMVAEFQSDDGPPIFLLSLKAGGTGLNLTAANHVIHLDRWWNPAVENQATDRAFRIGQKRNVQVRKMICTGTLEEHIDELIEEKKALADLVIRDGEGWLTELSTGDLQRLFTLSEVDLDD